MSTLTVSPRFAPPPAERPPSPDTPLRQVFERQLRHAGRAGQDDDTAPPAVDWGLLPLPAFPRADASPDASAPDGVAPAMPPCASPVTPNAEAPEGPRAPVSAAPSRVFDQLAAPLQAAAAEGRFEVLHDAAVTGIAIAPAGPGGRVDVTVDAPTAQATALVHHLPQLQRRLADRVTARVRVGDRNADPER